MEGFSTLCSYHVFLSFRGKDTRKTFTDHLYTALLHAGIRTFRDDDGLERGKNISSKLIKAIKESRISIIVFSKDYASSRWCLDELLYILECKKTVGHMILPIFYHVDPFHVRKQTGSFAEAFAKHEEQFMAETNVRKEEGMDKIKRWKEALREVADLAGLVLKDGYESNFIQEILKEIGNKLNRTVLSICSYPVGLDSRINDINLWLQDGSNEVGIVAIYGMRGIGKTTIAKTVYNLNFDRFESSSFLARVRETSEEPNGLVRLQRQLLSDIFKGKKVKISSVDEGIIKIRDAICSKRILLILDDVDQLDQLNAVLMMRGWFQQGSKIIITTTNEQLLKAHELYKMHKVKELTDDESFQLFSWHAFGQDQPIEGYMEHTERIVKYCGGLPLALQILGSSLSGRRVDVWESAIKKLEVIPDNQIITKLKISFDSLEGDHDKNLFLDIACFFVGKDQDFVITILDGCEYYAKVGIDNLIKRCLLTVNIYNKLTMHQLLQDMGREIIRQESPKEPGKRSRLWHQKDALHVLREKTGTKSIEGLILNLHESMLSERRGLGFSSWLHMNYALTESFSTSSEAELQTHAFSGMCNTLRLLRLNNVRFTGDYEEFPRKLRWLCWRGFPLKSIPSEFPLESLVVLDMRNSSLKQLWIENKLLRSLKILDLSHSHGLTNTPDFSKVPNLERLILKDCINLIEVHQSIGELGRLVLLNLKDCKNLGKLPLKIGQLKSLKNLILSGCSKLFQLPSELGKMESLGMLHADRTAISQSLSRTTKERSWRLHLWYWPSERRKNPESISFSLTFLPRLLTCLSLEGCNLSDDAIPRDLGSLSFLQELDLSGNPISRIPESIMGLTMLQSLYLENCTRLRSLPKLPISLKIVNLRNCRSLGMLTNLPNLFSFTVFARGCDKLMEVQKVFQLKPIGDIDAEMMINLGLCNLKFLRNVEVNLFNCIAWTLRKVPLQGLYECGIFSTFLPGSEVPGWFSFKSRGSSISFKVPSLPNLKIQGFNVCVVYARTGRCLLYCYIRISNRTNGLKWTYSPTFIGIPDDENKDHMIWLSHWKIKDQLQVADQVNVLVYMYPFFEVKELGVHVLLEQEDKGTVYNTDPCYPQAVDVADISAYQRTTGHYYLSNHDYFLRLLPAEVCLNKLNSKFDD